MLRLSRKRMPSNLRRRTLGVVHEPDESAKEQGLEDARALSSNSRIAGFPPPDDFQVRLPATDLRQIDRPARLRADCNQEKQLKIMKDFRGMKRQRNRNRKPSGNQNNPNRAYESNGPEGTKVRGNAQTIYEKYQQLARDANSSGDRVLAENHLQHAEHYFRMIRQMQPQRPVSEFLQRDPFASSFDVDFDEEAETEAAETETEASGGDDQPGLDDQPRYEQRDRQNGNRDHRQNGNGYNRDRQNGRDYRDNRQNDGRQNEGRQNDGRQNDRQNGERSFEPRNNRQNDNRQNAAPNGEGGDYDGEGGRRETRRERYERRRQQRLSEQEQGPVQPTSPGFIASTEPLAPRPLGADLAAAEQPPVRERAPRSGREAAPVADHLPAFLRAPAPAAAAEPEAAPEDAKPKRGRRRKSEDVGAAEEA